MSNNHDDDSSRSSAPDLPSELSRELHPSMGLSSDAAAEILRIIERDSIVNRPRRAMRGGHFTEYTKQTIEQRRHQKAVREQDD